MNTILTPIRRWSHDRRSVDAGVLTVLGVSALSIIALHLFKWPALIYTIFPKTASSQPSQNEFWDSGVLALAGELLRNGGVPYRNFWDHRPPLVHFVNAVALEISTGRLWGIWLSSLLCLLIILALSYYVLQRAFGSLAAATGVAFFAASLPPLLVLNSVEQYALPFQWAAIALFLVRHRFGEKELRLGVVLGALAALTFLIRNNVVASYITVLLLLSCEFVAHRRLKAWALFILGGLIGVGLVGSVFGLYLYKERSLTAFLDQVIRYNYLMYSAVDWKARLRAGYSGMLAASMTAPLLIPLAGWLAAILTFPRTAREDTSYLYWLGIIWLPMELLSASLLGRDDSRYFLTLLPPMAFLTALFVNQWVSNPIASSPYSMNASRRLTLALSIALFILPIAYVAKELKDQGASPETVDQIRSIVDYIDEETAPHDPIFIWGHAPEVYLFSRRTPATRFLDPSPVVTPGYADRALIRQLMEDLQASPPILIVDAATRSEMNAESTNALDHAEDLLPTLTRWDPEWRYPDSRKPEFFWWRQRPSLWQSAPALETLYVFLAQQYTLAAQVGPQKWAVYRRIDPPQRASAK